MKSIAVSLFALLLLIVLAMSSSPEAVAQFTDEPWNQTMAWSPDGSRMATGDTAGVIRIWDAAEYSLFLSIDGHADITALAWASDGSQFASGDSDGNVRVWDASDGERVAELRERGHSINSIAWDRAEPSRLFFGGAEIDVQNYLSLWDVQTNQVEALRSGETGSIVVSHDGQYVFYIASIVPQARPVSSLSTVIHFELPDDRENRIFGTTIEVSPDSSTVAVGYINGLVRLWDINTQTIVSEYVASADLPPCCERNAQWVNALHFEGNILSSATADGVFRSRDISTGQWVAETQIPPVFARTLFSPYGGRLAIISESVTRSGMPGVEILVPAPSLERLSQIAEACVRDGDARAAALTDSVPTQISDLDAFVAQVEALPADAIPAPCRADLLAVADALAPAPQMHRADQTPPLLERCGQPIDAPPLMLLQTRGDRIELRELFDTGSGELETHAIPESTSGIYSAVPLDGGEGYAILVHNYLQEQQRLSVITPGGNVYNTSVEPAGFVWNWIASGTQQQFTLVGYEASSSTAHLMTISWDESGLTFGAPLSLPFGFSLARTALSNIRVSPGARYIGLIPLSPDTLRQKFSIYSTTDQTLIWETPYDGYGLVDVLWYDDESGRVALVAGTTKETTSILTTVFANGDSAPFADLSGYFGEGAYIPSADTSAPIAPFWIVQEQGFRMLGLEAENNEIIDFCITEEPARIFQTPDGRYVIFTSSADSLSLRGVDLLTGDTFALPRIEAGTRPLAVATQPPASSFPVVYSIDSPGPGVSYILQTSTQTLSLGTSLVSQSPDRRHVAFVQDGSLRAFSNSTGQVVDVIAEDEISRIAWSDDQLLFNVAEISSYQFDLMTSQLEAIPLRSVPTAQSVSLPNSAPDEYRLFSPDYSHALYFRCYSGGTKVFFGETICKNGGRMVIYDVVNNAILRNVLSINTSDVDFGAAAWSPTGRYLAMPVSESGAYTTNVYLYDVVSRTTTDIPLGDGPKFSAYMGFRWSPDESALAWWRRDAAGLHRIEVYQMATGERLLTSVPAFSEQTGVFGAQWEWGRTLDSAVWVSYTDSLHELNFRSGNVIDLASGVAYLHQPAQPYPYPPLGCWGSRQC